MFSQACVKNSVNRGEVYTPPGRHPLPNQTATAADGTHPTRMHSCFKNNKKKIVQKFVIASCDNINKYSVFNLFFGKETPKDLLSHLRRWRRFVTFVHDGVVYVIGFLLSFLLSHTVFAVIFIFILIVVYNERMPLFRRVFVHFVWLRFLLTSGTCQPTDFTPENVTVAEISVLRPRSWRSISNYNSSL